MGLKGKIFKFMSDILKDESYYKLYTQAKSTSACGLPKGFFYISIIVAVSLIFGIISLFLVTNYTHAIVFSSRIKFSFGDSGKCSSAVLVLNEVVSGRIPLGPSLMSDVLRLLLCE